MPWSSLPKNSLSANTRRAPVTVPDECRERWLNAVYACRGELAIVRINMEDAGVNAPLVFDLSAMDAALDRMEMLAATLVERSGKVSAAVRLLLNTLVHGLLEDIAYLLAGAAEFQPAGAQDGGTYRPRWRTLYRPQPQGILADVGCGHRGRIPYRLYRGDQTSSGRQALAALCGSGSDRNELRHQFPVAADLRSCAGHQAAGHDRSHAGGYYPPQPG